MGIKQPLLAITFITCIFLGFCKDLNVSVEYKTAIQCNHGYLPLIGEPLAIVCQYGLPREAVHSIEIKKIWNTSPDNKLHHLQVFYYDVKLKNKSDPIKGSLHNRTSYIFTNNSLELNISSLKLSDYGTYQCIVENSDDGDGATYLDKKSISELPTKQHLGSQLALNYKQIYDALCGASVGGFGNVTLTAVVKPGSKYLPPVLECIPLTVKWRLEGKNTKIKESSCLITSIEKTKCDFSITENQLKPGGKYYITVILQQYVRESEIHNFSLIYEHRECNYWNGVLVGASVSASITLTIVCILATFIWMRKKRMSNGEINGADEERHQYLRKEEKGEHSNPGNSISLEPQGLQGETRQNRGQPGCQGNLGSRGTPDGTLAQKLDTEIL